MICEELDPIAFKHQLESCEQNLLIDVREEYEFEDHNIGGTNIPMSSVLAEIKDLKANKAVFVCCQTGKRSRAIGHHLAKHLNPIQVYSLRGGIDAYTLVHA